MSVDRIEAKALFLKYAKSIEEEDRQKRLILISEHIKNGKIEEALTIAKEKSAS